MAQLVEEIVGHEGGIEDRVSSWAGVLKFLGFASAAGAIFLSGYVTKTSSYGSWGGNGLDWGFVALGVSCLIYTLTASVALSAGAEILRLLKKLNGLTPGGVISDAQPISRYVCSECGEEQYHSGMNSCIKCEERFDSEDESE